jgi:ribosomal-protein-alanine N-acetyltransferase
MKKESIYRIFSKLPELQTERFILRRMLPEDADDMYEYAHDAQVTEYLTWSPHQNKGYTRDYLLYIKGRYRVGDFFDWAIVCKDTGKMIGTCGFTRFDYANNCGEIGYVVNPSYQGQGIATEVCAKIIEFGFCRLELNRIECKYMVGNEASRRVMEKNGMMFEGIQREKMLVKGQYRDIGICSLLKSDFDKNKS